MLIPVALLHREGQPDGDRHAFVYARAGRLDGTVVRGHEGTGDPESKTKSRSILRMPMAAEKFLPEQGAIVGIESGALIGNRDRKLPLLLLPPNGDHRLRR